MNNAAAVACALLLLCPSVAARADQPAPETVPAAPDQPADLTPPPVGEPGSVVPPPFDSTPGQVVAPGPAPVQAGPVDSMPTTTAAAEGGAPSTASDDWTFMADAGGSVMLTQPQASLFRPGVTGSLAAFRSFAGQPSLMLGLRLRGAIFTNGDPPDDNRADPGLGGLGAALLAVRLRPGLAAGDVAPGTGPWAEFAAGGGLTGKLVRPMGEAGVGWNFSAGPVLAGPMVRYHRVVQFGDDEDGADANILFFGVEIGLRPKAAPPPPPPAPIEAPALPAAPAIDSDGDGVLDLDDRCPSTPEDVDGFEDGDGCPDEDNDRDGIPDTLDKCRDQPEVVNGVDDEDGCPDEGLITMIDDRVVLQEEVLFETDRSRVSSSGRRALEAVERLCRQHPEWEQIEVEGHADERGTAEYNQKLSEDRATRVRAVLLELGFADDRVTIKGFGATRPRAAGRDEASLQLNRRVELVVVGKRPAGSPAPVAPVKPPAKPLLVRPPAPRRVPPPGAAPGSTTQPGEAKPGAPPEAKPETPPAKPPAPPPSKSSKPGGRSKSGTLPGVEEGQ